MRTAFSAGSPSIALGSREPNDWPSVHLSDVCNHDIQIVDPRKHPEQPFRYIDIASVDNKLKRITEPRTLFGKEAPSRARQRIMTGDVLVATTRPNLNAVAQVPAELNDGIASTGFCVLRPAKCLDSDYLFAFVRSNSFNKSLSDLVKGALYPAVSDNQVFAQCLSLPPLPVQRRIAAHIKAQLEEVDKARTALQAQIAAANALPTASLRAVFGDPAYSGAGAAQVTLGEILTLRKEVIHPRDRPTDHATFVGLEHVESRTGARLGAVELDLSALTGRKPRFYKGDIVYGYLRPYLNKVWLADFDGVCSVDQYVYTVDRTRADAEFVSWFMRSPRYLSLAPVAETPGQLPRIRTQEVAQVPLRLPALAVQHSLAARLRAEFAGATELRQSLSARLATLDQFPAALLRQVFGQTPQAAENLHS